MDKEVKILFCVLIVFVFGGVVAYVTVYEPEIEVLNSKIGNLERDNFMLQWDNKVQERRITVLLDTISDLKNDLKQPAKQYYNILHVRLDSIRRNYMVYTNINDTRILLYENMANYKCVNWAIEHIAENGKIILHQLVIDGPIDFSKLFWGCTLTGSDK